jgi:hypothetical protein
MGRRIFALAVFLLMAHGCCCTHSGPDTHPCVIGANDKQPAVRVKGYLFLSKLQCTPDVRNVANVDFAVFTDGLGVPMDHHADKVEIVDDSGNTIIASDTFQNQGAVPIAVPSTTANFDILLGTLSRGQVYLKLEPDNTLQHMTPTVIAITIKISYKPGSTTP